MQEKLKDIEAMAKAARKLGLKSLTIGDVAIEVGEKPTRRTRTAPNQPKTVEEQLPEYTDEQVLGWSVYGEEP